MKNCEYCSEQIQDDAKKCRFCGEWLTDEKREHNVSAFDRGTVDARAVAKGIKQKELEENNLKVGGAILLIAACFLGYYTNFWVGVIFFVVIFGTIVTKYNKE
ncbi:MAG: hypothetical protein US63_C0022G0010 [Candidatus Moranbacteria bacterium GW2011_GWC2_37_8]|nr:MAG: hypothetical protein US63_C0022G0010 [Candidatus Moranbacteria bacterium GW2011_GWC2_37_8]